MDVSAAHLLFDSHNSDSKGKNVQQTPKIPLIIYIINPTDVTFLVALLRGK